MNNRDVAETFERVADMLAIRGDNIHRILAYRKAAESVRGLGRDINTVHAKGELTQIPGIGATLAEKIEELLTTDKLEFYERLAEQIPPELVGLLRVEGLGPKRVMAVYEALGITTLEGLKEAAESGALRKLSGMGRKTEENILAGIEALERHGDDRALLGVAWPEAQALLAELNDLEGVTRSAVGGSLRRMRETIGDLDLLVAAEASEHIMDHFVKLPQVETVVVKGPSKSTVQLFNGLQVDLRVLPEARWGTLLSYFTGSKDHNVRLRELALKKGLSLNEHAFRPMADGEPTSEGEIVCDTEEGVYEVLDLPYIAPTLREDRGEIEAAMHGELPQLLQQEQIMADLHMHSTWSDGRLRILEMAEAARSRGLQYIAITDHSVSLGIANGLSVERLRQQAEEVAEANEAMGPDFRILHGTEMEIRADGTLDYPDDVLAELDFVIASLHVSLSQPRQQVTERALRAIENPHVDMLAHPSGRLLPDRPGADLDMDRIFAAAARTGTILEVNANPRRLDLRDVHVRRALEQGVTLAVNTDAHSAGELDLLHFGVATAQRGWAQTDDVVNTWSLARLLDFLQGRG
ncbi:MAG TPA: DNA polymerase/3'-5' exonuclease PolX [Candidatus Sulfomarinibacteraceae bacterium]|nr:DNA polymerase/3'-5' exonuclease PolX [Candidatus Sulfomarinibacteraceae bacterium]